MPAKLARRSSSLFADSPANMSDQPWTSRIDVDAMIDSMARKAPNVKPPHVQLIKQLLSSISNVARDHPVYPVMIREAMGRLNGGLGFSKDEVSEFIERNYDVSPVMNCARVVFELDKLVKGREIVLTAENRYLVVRSNEDENEDGLIRDKGRKRGRHGGKGCRGRKARRVVEENVEDDDQNVRSNGGEAIECEEDIEKEELPPGFEVSVIRNERSEELVGCEEVERIDVLRGDDGRKELSCGRGSEEDCLQEGGERVVGGNEGSRDLQQEPLEAIEATALVVTLPNEEEEGGEDPTTNQVNPTFTAQAECPQQQRKLQQEHDRVLSTIGDLSETVAKLRDKNLQSDEARNKNHCLFDKEHYTLLLMKTEAVQLALKDVMGKLKTVDESEVAKEKRREGKRKQKGKHGTRSGEVDRLVGERASIESQQLKRPTKLKIVFSPPRRRPPLPPLRRSESSEGGPEKVASKCMVAKGLNPRSVDN